MRNGYQHLVGDYLVARVRELGRERAARLQALRSRREAETYQAEVRRAIAKAFGPLPARTPLNAQTTGTVERKGYRIEKVVFESRPNCPVTGNLYLPDKCDRPLPAILVGCGHALTGKAHPLYQAACQRLVQAGFVALIYDPFSQGERDQHGQLPHNHALRRNCVLAHSMLGKQLELLGEFFGAWRTWDSRRALDYLASRPEVDPDRLGMTGNSGGGTETTWLWPQDDRLKLAAPCCFLTTFQHNLENELPSDAEQYPPGILGAGLELADFFIARAPAPVMLLAQKYDFFDRRGFREICAEVKSFYRLFGAERNVGAFLGNHPHGFFPDTQQAMVSFFCRQVGFRIPRPASLIPEDAATLTVGVKSRVVAAGTWMANRSRQLAAQRQSLTKKQLAAELTKLLHLPRRSTPPHYRILRPVPTNSAVMARYAVETEANLRAILTEVLERGTPADTLDVEKSVHLYVPHFAAEMAELPKQRPLYLVDVRGRGESAPDDAANFFHPVGNDYMFHGFHLLLGESYLGRRVHDVLTVIDLLVAEGAKQIQLHGSGQGALLALFAALLHPQVHHTTLHNAPRSFTEWAQAPVVTWPAANFPHGILQTTDIPDCLAALGKTVTVRQGWNPLMKSARATA